MNAHKQCSVLSMPKECKHTMVLNHKITNIEPNHSIECDDNTLCYSQKEPLIVDMHKKYCHMCFNGHTCGRIVDCQMILVITIRTSHVTIQKHNHMESTLIMSWGL